MFSLVMPSKENNKQVDILGYSWVGVRTEDFEDTMHFLTQILGLTLTERAAEADIAHFRLPSGQHLEVFGPRDAGIQTTTCPVLGFEVADVRAARHELEAVGVPFVGEVSGSDEGAMWTYFRGPDGQLYELQRPEQEYRSRR
jgi:catechol 2,3-dioxygenase-like lactoylglutathione lyase family enzyme